MINSHDSFCSNWCTSRRIINVFNTFSHQSNTISSHLLVTFNDTLVLEEFIHEAAAVQWYVHSSVNVQKATWSGGILVDSARMNDSLHEAAGASSPRTFVWMAIASQWTDGPAGLWLGTEWECRCHRTDIDVFPHFRALPTHGQPNGSVDVWLVKSCAVLIVSVGGSWWTRSVHHWPKRTSCKSSTDLSYAQRWLH